MQQRERRRLERRSLEVPIHFEGGSGMTTDVNANGVAFATCDRVAIGTELHFALLVESVAEPPVALACEGRVVRVETRECDTALIAATIDSIQIKDASVFLEMN